MDAFKLLIGGALVDGAATLDVLNPATETVVATAPRADRAQLDQAVAAAKAAFPGWAATPWAERQAALVKIADAIQANADRFARLLTQEQGKPLPEAQMEVAGMEGFFRYFASLSLTDEVLEASEARHVVRQFRPLGVVGAIIPWNFPLMILAFKLPPALLAGNTVVVKPAPTTPLGALLLGELCQAILPPGVLNVIVDANDLGGALTSHPDVAKVSFTGSTETGRKVMASAAGTLKRLTLELGGNDAAIVLDDIDPKALAPQLFQSAFLNAGQVCLAIKRLYVQDGVYDAVCSELAAMADAVVLDNGLQQGAQMGPLQNRAQYDKVKSLIEDSRSDGQIIAGGVVPEGPGYFIRPTIVRDIEDGARLVDEEQFGPVLPVIRIGDEQDAIDRANRSPFGLGASVWSRDAGRARAVAEQLLAGTVWINKHMDVAPNIPFGGAKQSGIGVEFGLDGLREYTQARVINGA
jgi:acyl-CoA reductase-like NAD-dependent aldehyde dehydrogenase